MPLNIINRINIIEEGNKYEKKGTWWIFKRRRNVPNEVLLILWALLKIYDFLEIFFF